MGWFKQLLGLEASIPVEIHSITDENFKQEVLKSELPVLLDVWSDGCGPCKMLEPVIVELSKAYRGRLKVAEVNVAHAPKALSKLRVSATPTVLYFHRGKERERVVGYRAAHYHRDYIDGELLPAIGARGPAAGTGPAGG
jgi:thioredoxin 1